jgi:FkbM family methyltransferase
VYESAIANDRGAGAKERVRATHLFSYRTICPPIPIFRYRGFFDQAEASLMSRNRTIGLLETLTRKAQTLSSIAHSKVLVRQDGNDSWRMAHVDRLRYLQLQPALRWKKGLVVYDIGANEGEFAGFIANFDSVSTVYCFEPLPHVFSKLIEETRPLKKISCFQVAIGDTTGIKSMYINEFSPSSSILPIAALHAEEFPFTDCVHPIDVQVQTLQDVVDANSLLPPDFIKIDVQGFEDRVIRGGTNIVGQARFCMLELSLVSLYKDSLLISDMNAIMRDLGFGLVKFLKPVVGRSGEILQIDGLFKKIE